MAAENSEKPQGGRPPRRRQRGGQRPRRGRRKSPRSQAIKTTQAAETSTPEPLDRPARECDFVANGEVAGFFVHCAAAVELSKSFVFRHLGGSSVGAFCTAAVAAAEYGRGKGFDGFAEMGKLAEEMGETGKSGAPKLFDLLRPDSPLRRHVDCLTASVNADGRVSLLRMAFAAARRFPGISILAALPGLLLVAGALFVSPLWAQIVWATVGLVLAAGLPPVVALVRMVRGLDGALRENGYGFCSGAGDLTPWLSRTLNRLAGRNPDGAPLTFGDLWGERHGEAGEKKIDLQLTAADVSLGAPVRLPFDRVASSRVEDVYYFREEELRRFFPAAIVDHLVARTRTNKYFHRVRGYLPLPEPADLPVAFAVRLAAGFPLLVSSVPLYRAYCVKGRGRQHWHMRLSRIVGGGIGGKTPLYVFDRMLPLRPTFAVHIAPVGEESSDPAKRRKGIWVQNLVSQQGPSLWLGFGSIFSWLSGLAQLAGNWSDHVMLHTPGFKERMAVAKIAPEHAGWAMCLNREDCRHLLELGRSTGSQLARRFEITGESPRSLSWTAHRWIRFRMVMAQLENSLRDMRAAYHDADSADATFDHLIMRPADEAPDAFRWVDISQRNHALRVTNQLLGMIERWEQDRFSFTAGELPEPESEFKLLPKL